MYPPLESIRVARRRMPAATPPLALLLLALMSLSSRTAIAQMGSRCTWSPDSRHLLYLARANHNSFVACYDATTGKSHRVLTAPKRDTLCGVSWSLDGTSFATVSLNTSHPIRITSHYLPFPRLGEPLTHTELLGDSYTSNSTLLFTDSHLWLSPSGTLQWQPQDGTIRRVAHASGEDMRVVGVVDKQIAYVATNDSDDSWAIGTLHPTPHARRPMFDCSQFPGWGMHLYPAFSPTFSRVAMHAYNEATEKMCLLVLEAGKILTSIELGDADIALPFDLAWSPDGATVFSYLHRRKANGVTQRLLFESTFSGSASRETKLFESNNTSVVRTPYALSISPDGTTAAATVRHSYTDDPVLYLVDLTDKARTVTTIESPPSIEVVLRGSDMVLEAAGAWQSAWAAKSTERRMLLRGGGSAAGIKAICAGEAHFALTSRAATETEEALAKAVGLTLTTHCIVRDVVAVCVHPDNPLTSIDKVQLQTLFTQATDKHWSQLGITIPEASDDIATALLLPGSPQYTPFRKAVLNNRSPAGGHTVVEDVHSLGLFVGKNRNSLACLPIDEALALGDEVRILAIDEQHGAVAPTEAAIQDGSYPLTYSWFVVTTQNLPPRGKALLQWLDTDAGRQAGNSFRWQAAGTMNRNWLRSALVSLVALAHLPTPGTAQHGNLCCWSPNGLQLLFVGRDDQRQFVARYDIATQSATRAFLARRGDRIHALQWSPDGRQFAVVCSPKADTRRWQPKPEPLRSTVHVLRFPSGAIVKTLSPRLPPRTSWGTPIWTDAYLLIEAPGLVECNLATGKMHAWSRPWMEADAILGAFGSGIGYLSIRPAATGGWSLGTLHAKTLARTAYCNQQLAPDAAIQHLPAFAPTRERIALPAVVGTTRSLLLIEHDELLETRALGPQLDLKVDDLQWAPRSDTVYVLASRPIDDGETQHALIEVKVPGDGLRETNLFVTRAPNRPRPDVVRVPRSLAVASHGRTAAVVAGIATDADPALYLIDLDRQQRKITRVPFPDRNHLVLCGSDRMTDLAVHWRGSYRPGKHPEVEVLGGGSTAGIEKLIHHQADVALVLRAVTADEQTMAATAGLELITTVVRRQTLAVCVHPDNPVAAIELAQLNRLFTVSDEHRWPQLGVDLPDDDKIAMAMLVPGSPGYMPFRKSVLKGRMAMLQPATKNSTTELGAYVAANRNAIACLPLREARRLDSAVRIVPLSLSDKPPVAPSASTIQDGTYPLVDSWFIVHDRKASRRVRAFCDWLASDAGQAVTVEIGRETDK